MRTREPDPHRLLTGPAGSGKTHRALSLVREAATTPGRRGRGARAPGDVLLVLPTYAQAMHLKRVALSAWNARAVLDDPFATFTSAGERFVPGFRVRGLPSPDERDRLMEEALRRAAVETFERVADRPGFRARLLRLTKELKQSGRKVADIAGRLARLAPRLETGAGERLTGFLRVFEAYQALLDEAQMADHEDALRALLERLAAGAAARVPRLLVVDGFDDFTPVEEAILGSLVDAVVERGGRAVVTLPWDEARPALFAASAPLRARLLARGYREERLAGFPRAPGTALARLAADLFAPAAPEASVADDTVEVLVAGDSEDEAEALARHARRLREEGVLEGWRDLGIVVRRIDAAGPRIVSAFARLGVPARVVGQGTALAAEPLVRAVRGALRVLGGRTDARHFQSEDVDAWLRWTAHAAGDADLLDAVDLREIEARRQGFPEDWTAYRQHALPAAAPALDGLERAREALAALRGAPSVYGALADAIGDLAPLPPYAGLDEAGRSREPEGDALRRRAAGARARLRHILGGLERAALRTGIGQQVDVREAVDDLLEAVDRAHLSLPDRRLDVVNVIDAEEARYWELPVVFTAGLAGGAFPLHPREDVLLRDAERETLSRLDGALSLPLARDREGRERRLFYGAVTRARRRLVLSRPGCTEDGEPRAASPFLRDVAGVVRARSIGTPRPPGRPAPLHAECFTRRDLALYAAAHASATDVSAEEGALARALLARGDPAVLRRAARWRRPVADPLEDDGDGGRFRRSVEVVSPTTVNAAVACRHRHFLRRVVGIPEDDVPLAGPAFDVRDEGTLVHAALRRAVEAPEEDEAIVVEGTLRDHGGSMGAWERELVGRDLERMVRLFRRRETVLASPLAPIAGGLERSFGRGGELTLGAGTHAFAMEGRMDRVDAHRGDAVVIDYKLSANSVTAGERGYRKGEDLQLPLYGAAVEVLTGLRVVGLEWVAARTRYRRGVFSEARVDLLDGRREGVQPKQCDDELFRRILHDAVARAGDVVSQLRRAEHVKQQEDPERCAHRFLHLVERHRLPVRRLTALTFTEKAAAQMRERIATLLGERGRRDEQQDVEFAPISTIHAFCARLLRVHAVEAGVDPAFRVLDESESRLLREDAAVASERALRLEDPAVAAALTAVDAGRDDLVGFLDRLRGAGLDVTGLRWRVEAAAEDRARVEDAIGAFLAGASYDAFLSSRAATVLEECRAALDGGVDAAFELAAAAAAVHAVTPRKGNGKRGFLGAKKTLRELLEQEASARLDRLAARDYAPHLIQVLAVMQQTYDEMKEERGALDFTDLEVRTLRLLDTLAARDRPLAHVPAALLVDEYQDTNPLQGRILERLRRQGCTQFSVGDPKQSIYRFRRADVRVLAEESRRVGAERNLALTHTFRARPALVDCFNHFHERLFADAAAGVAHVPMKAAGAFRDGPGPEIELAVVDGGGGVRVADARRGEARWIAAWIRQFVGRRIERSRLDGGGAATPPRTLSYGDIAILLRARTDLETYEEALLAAKIPFRTHKGRGYFLTEEIGDLLHVLRALHDPADTFALACAMTGPTVGATDGDLLRWFPDSREADRDRLEPWRRFLREADAGGTHASAASTYRRLRTFAVAGSLRRVLEGVLDDLGLMDVVLLQPDGERRGANLRKTLALARAIERDGRHGLADLLRHVELLREREVREAEASLGRGDEDVVQINTVHGAKGLEYPVVILADVGRREQRRAPGLVFDEDGGFTAKLRHPLEGTAMRPAAYEALDAIEKRFDVEESVRLLYVALTRAEEKVLITGACTGWTRAGKPAHFDGWGERLRTTLDLDLSSASGARTVDMGTGRFRYAVVDPPVASPAPVPVRVEAGADAGREADALLARAGREAAPLGGTPYVVTVSELLAFAHSPSRLYGARMAHDAQATAAPSPAPEPEDPASGDEVFDPEAERRAEAERLWDEGTEVVDGLDRAALGRAFHVLLERLRPGEAEPAAEEIRRAVAEEFASAPPAETPGRLGGMVRRFLRSDTGRRFRAALDGDEDVRREVSFHARIRFPAGARVGPFESLLVRGSMDLWLPEGDGVVIVDYKTNPPGTRFRDPDELARYYDWQLRLYALAAERIRGEDVAGARLVLVDDGWGREAVEIAVDIGGGALEEARRLCQAFARAELEARWPGRWKDLLAREED
ncbi:MAG: UvrD-helicase domain-containing protein [Planctomycetota bacterium]|jgi:ATP-dependent helicase/nuclease subunit A